MITALFLTGIVVAGCATPEPGSPEAVYLEQQKMEEVRLDAIEETVEELPDWYTEFPTDAYSVYAVGTATSPDLQLAMDKGTLNAKRSLADRINGLISSKLKEFVTEVGQGENSEVVSEAERVTSNLITEVNVSGYYQENAKVLAQGNRYRAYVLLKYPVGKANDILVDQVKNNRILEGKLRASKAFKELEDEIKRTREQN
ncbi:MAG: LPP20 family lipoprotein [Alphaproteobacteria bacterium]|nr:LPP20 family lipoprotein [Alphaproteobacteria bacterium]